MIFVIKDLKKVKDGIYFNTADYFELNKEVVEFLEKITFEEKIDSVRICLHKTNNDLVHQMIILHKKGKYVRPHKHIRKNVSYHMIKGELLFFLMDDTGKVLHREKIVSDVNSDFNFGFRIKKDQYYFVYPLSEYTIFHEIITGPFNGVDDNIFPDWAPVPGDVEEELNFIEHILDI